LRAGLAFPLLLALFLLAPGGARGQSTTLSGGLDLRAGRQTRPEAETVTGLSSAFLNLRKVFADEAGDRWILVGQVDVEEHLDDTHPYQVYAQYKGPLGRWNLRAGRYLVPFGLHAYYDTERLPLPAHEGEALGLKLDEGLQLFGYRGAFDYALSVTRGIDGRATPIARVGWQGEDVRLGLSFLEGRLPSFADAESVETDELLPGARLIHKRRLALDYEQALGPLTLRAEPLVGTDEGERVWGAYAEGGYALSERWEVAANAALLDSGLTGRRWRAGASLAWRVRGGVFLRGAYLHRNDFGRSSDLFVAQLYAEFSRALGK